MDRMQQYLNIWQSNISANEILDCWPIDFVLKFT